MNLLREGARKNLETEIPSVVHGQSPGGGLERSPQNMDVDSTKKNTMINTKHENTEINTMKT